MYDLVSKGAKALKSSKVFFDKEIEEALRLIDSEIECISSISVMRYEVRITIKRDSVSYCLREYNNAIPTFNYYCDDIDLLSEQVKRCAESVKQAQEVRQIDDSFDGKDFVRFVGDVMFDTEPD